jgi:hypothetical protein
MSTPKNPRKTDDRPTEPIVVDLSRGEVVELARRYAARRKAQEEFAASVRAALRKLPPDR